MYFLGSKFFLYLLGPIPHFKKHTDCNLYLGPSPRLMYPLNIVAVNYLCFLFDGYVCQPHYLLLILKCCDIKHTCHFSQGHC